MTLREAIQELEGWRDEIESDAIHANDKASSLEAFRMVLDTARQHMDDTAEIVLPCATCGGKGEVVHQWGDGTAAVSPCPTCCKTPVPSPGQE